MITVVGVAAVHMMLGSPPPRQLNAQGPARGEGRRGDMRRTWLCEARRNLVREPFTFYP